MSDIFTDFSEKMSIEDYKSIKPYEPENGRYIKMIFIPLNQP